MQGMSLIALGLPLLLSLLLFPLLLLLRLAPSSSLHPQALPKSSCPTRRLTYTDLKLPSTFNQVCSTSQHSGTPTIEGLHHARCERQPSSPRLGGNWNRHEQ